MTQSLMTKNRSNKLVNQDRPPNFRDGLGKLYLVRCFACGGHHGTENWAFAVASGYCAWCRWPFHNKFGQTSYSDLERKQNAKVGERKNKVRNKN